ncbi:MAG: S41 family peptidase [Candidatus Promineifilaceae bacterium]|nr:S41 family peptidase [Candidatus Promineifilaceae bacterium]
MVSLQNYRSKIFLSGLFLIGLAWVLIGCNQPQSPEEYLDTAIDWIASNSISAGDVNWDQVRSEAHLMTTSAQTYSDTYPAIEYALDQLPESIHWFSKPEDTADIRDYGLMVLETEHGATIINIDPNGPTAAAGLAIGDVIEMMEGSVPVPDDPDSPPPRLIYPEDEGQTLDLEILRAAGGERKTLSLSARERAGRLSPSGRLIEDDRNSLGYINLAYDVGLDSKYAPMVQEIIEELDSLQTCGWVIDLRTTPFGDIWSYLAALGPFLGEGQMGGFLYPDGRRELWERKDSQVYWDGNKRYESEEIDDDYPLQVENPPVAILISPLTELAGELVLVAFQGRADVRTIGEATRGHPHFQAVTSMSDGAIISTSGAYAFDRSGLLHKNSFEPDENIAVDWQKIGQEDDPVLRTAQEWLLEHPQCKE